MKTAAIIAEFNPFHNGHAYLIKQAKKITGADRIIVIMSGNFVQRGEPAFMDKYTRTAHAIQNGADVVIELPTVYAVSQASFFALGAIKMIKKLRCVDYLCFGCETDNLELLSTIANVISEESEVYSETLQSYLKNGFSFAKSRENAILKTVAMGGLNISAENVLSVIQSPNSILAIEYLNALKKSHCNTIPVAIIRSDSGYKNNSLRGPYAGAMAIRGLYSKPSTFSFINIKETLKSLVPQNELSSLEENYKVNYPIYMSDFDNMIGMSLVQDKFETKKMDAMFDTTFDLTNRMRNFANKYISAEKYINDCNAPTITSSRISRILLYMLFNYRKDDFTEFRKDDYVYYFRILGFNKNHTDVLALIKESTPFPLITRVAKAADEVSKNGMRMFAINQYADYLYRSVVMNKYGNEIPTEEESEVVIL